MRKHRYLRRDGYVLVALHVDEDDFAFAERFAEREGYFGPADFLQSILTPELWRWRDQFEDLLTMGPPPQFYSHDNDEDLVIVEDEVGHADLACGQTDLDDDIPF